MKFPADRLLTLPTPCYLIDSSRFSKGINDFSDALGRRFPRHIVGYSVKTNSLPWLIREAGKLGCFAEVVSEDEYKIARECGYSPDRIVYNGPLKSESTVRECLEHGGYLNIETWRDVRWAMKYCPRHRGVGIRIKADLQEIAPGECSGVNDDSRFGFSEKSGELRKAVECLCNSGIRISGIHIHRTTHSRSVDYYRCAARYVGRIVKEYGLAPAYIDIGGGFYGIVEGKPSFNEYTEAIYKELDAAGLSDILLIVEPGSAVSAWALKMLSGVIDSKQGAGDVRYVTIDASRNDVDPFFRKKGFMYDLIYRNSADSAPVCPSQIIGGYTCLEDDRFMTLEDVPELREGDVVCFNRVGAYTMTMTARFIRLQPAVYVAVGDEFVCVREAETTESFMEGNI